MKRRLELVELVPAQLPRGPDPEAVKGCCETHYLMAVRGSNREQRRKVGTRCSGYDGPMPLLDKRHGQG